MAENNRNLLTVDEVAKHFRVDPSTVRRWISHGALEAIELPRAGSRKAYRVRRDTLSVFDSSVSLSPNEPSIVVVSAP